jgi:hypothetical protein
VSAVLGDAPLFSFILVVGHSFGLCFTMSGGFSLLSVIVWVLLTLLNPLSKVCRNSFDSARSLC